MIADVQFVKALIFTRHLRGSFILKDKSTNHLSHGQTALLLSGRYSLPQNRKFRRKFSKDIKIGLRFSEKCKRNQNAA